MCLRPSASHDKESRNQGGARRHEARDRSRGWFGVGASWVVLAAGGLEDGFGLLVDHARECLVFRSPLRSGCTSPRRSP